MESSVTGLRHPKYSLSTIGGIFGTSDHERFSTIPDEVEFNCYFPPNVRGHARAMYEAGIDALAAILVESAGPQDRFRLWTPENICDESISRLRLKLNDRFDQIKYRCADDLQRVTRQDFVLFLHLNCYDPASAEQIEFLRRNVGATVIEDFVQAPLDLARFTGDFAFTSLRKFTSVDLAIAYQKNPRPAEVGSTKYHHVRKEAERVRTHFLSDPTEEREQQFLRLTRESDAALAVPEICAAHPNEIARAKQFDFTTALRLRRDNHSRISEHLIVGFPQTKILPGDYMYLMLETSHRDRYRSDMFAQRIFPVIHWADSRCEQVKTRLSLHIDQRYTLSDMDRTAAVMTQTRDQLAKE